MLPFHDLPFNQIHDPVVYLPVQPYGHHICSTNRPWRTLGTRQPTQHLCLAWLCQRNGVEVQVAMFPTHDSHGRVDLAGAEGVERVCWAWDDLVAELLQSFHFSVSGSVAIFCCRLQLSG